MCLLTEDNGANLPLKLQYCTLAMSAGALSNVGLELASRKMRRDAVVGQQIACEGGRYESLDDALQLFARQEIVCCTPGLLPILNIIIMYDEVRLGRPDNKSITYSCWNEI